MRARPRNQRKINTEPTLSPIADTIAKLRDRVARAEAEAGRKPGSVTLLAVTKTVDAQRVREALQAGITDVGENYIQEARAKIPLVMSDRVSADKLPVWHFIGHLQRNKAKDAVALFDLIQTVDNLPLAQEIGKQAIKQGKKTQPVLLEVRLGRGGSETGERETRAGIAPEQVLDFAAQAAGIDGIAVRGLMAIAPYGTTGETARPFFAQMRNLWDGLPPENRHELSMGMSNDWEAAVNEGATILRLGTALFGRRDSQ